MKGRDVVFSTIDGEELLLDVYRPPARETLRSAVVLIHGGSWAAGRRTDMDWPASELADAGYVAFTIDYRLLFAAEGRNFWPVQVDDVQRAVRWIRANAAAYGVDPDRIAAYGHSSGGHLAALLGTTESRDNSDPVLAAFSSRVSCVVSPETTSLSFSM